MDWKYLKMFQSSKSARLLTNKVQKNLNVSLIKVQLCAFIASFHSACVAPLERNNCQTGVENK